VAARNRLRKPGRPHRSRVRLLHLPPIWVGWALASPRRCKRPALAVVVQFHPYPPIANRSSSMFLRIKGEETRFSCNATSTQDYDRLSVA